jgi:hypothetical protein
MIKEKMGSNGVASVWGRRKEREREGEERYREKEKVNTRN